MDTPEVAVARYAAQISTWALWVSGAALVVSSALFALELRRWFDEGVRLSLTVSPDMTFYGGDAETDGRIYLSLVVTNRGSAATSITNMLLFNYPNSLSLWVPGLTGRWIKNVRPATMVVNRPGEIPHVLTPGMVWRGVVEQTPKLADMIGDRRLYVGIAASHRDRPILRRVRPRIRWD